MQSSKNFGTDREIRIVIVHVVPVHVDRLIAGVPVDVRDITVRIARATFAISHPITGVLRAKLLRFSSTQRVFFRADT